MAPLSKEVKRGLLLGFSVSLIVVVVIIYCISTARTDSQKFNLIIALCAYLLSLLVLAVKALVKNKDT
jgi:hypothetical protein